MLSLETFILSKKYTDSVVESSGGGDMLKTVYDKDRDGVVDKAKTVEWNNISDMPNLYDADDIDIILEQYQPVDYNSSIGDIGTFDSNGHIKDSGTNLALLINTINSKANTSDLASKADISDLDTKADLSDLDDKADKSDLDDKADTSYVDYEIGLLQTSISSKLDSSEAETRFGEISGDITSINTALNGKASTSALADKADTSYVNTQLNAKADKTELSGKVDISDFNTLSSEVANKTTKNYVDGLIDDLSQSINIINSSIGNIEQGITEINGDISTLQSNVVNIQSAISTINGNITSLQSAISTINSSIVWN